MRVAPVLFLATVLCAAEAWGRAEDTGSSRSRGSAGYQAPVEDRAPDVLCGCTEVLKNFA